MFYRHSNNVMMLYEQGLETERPVLQVDRYVFIGEHEDAVGTSVLFEQVKPESE